MSAPAGDSQRIPGARDEQGWSLVEVMLGGVLTLIGLAGILIVTLHVARLRTADQELGLAFQACRNTLEEIRTLPLADVAALDGTGFDVEGPLGSAGFLPAVAGDEDGLPGRISVQVIDNTPLLLRVRASATWNRGAGRRSFALDTTLGARP